MAILDNWGTFLIRTAGIDDAKAITRVAQEAYFEPKIAELTCRKIEKKATFGAEDILRRLRDPATYTVLVAEDAGQIVGTAYYQKKNTDFIDNLGFEVGEIGLLAVDPKYWKSSGIGSHLVNVVKNLAAIDRQVQAVYLYAIGKQIAAGAYAIGRKEEPNSLPKFYEKHGFQFVTNRTSSKRPDLYDTPDGSIDQVVMVFSKQDAQNLQWIQRKKEEGKLNIPRSGS